MLYQLTSVLPTVQELIDLENATTVRASTYLNMVEKRLDAELEIARLNAEIAENAADEAEIAQLRRFYGMNYDAPADMVERYHDRNGYSADTDASLFPVYSSTRMKLEKAAKIAALKQRSNLPPFIPDSVFEAAIKQAESAGIPLENISIGFGDEDDEPRSGRNSYGADRLASLFASLLSR